MTSELDDLEHALDLANKVRFGLLPGPQKAEALEQVSRLRNKFDALDASILSPFDICQEHRIEGHVNPVEWLKHHTRAKGPDAARRRKLSRRLRHMPHAHQAMADGAITVEHVDVLAWARREVGHENFEFAEERLVEAASDQRFTDFWHTVEYFVVRVRPANANRKERRQLEGRFASSSRTFQGNGVVNAEFEPVGFTVWDQELNRCYQHLLIKDRAEAHDRLGRRPLDHELGRTARQRRVDAMQLMAERSAAFDGDLGPSSLSVTAHADVTLLACVVAVLRQALAGDDPDFDLDEALDDIELTTDSLHELDDGTVITVNTIVLALLTGTVRGILFDPTGEILRFGRERRLFSPAQAKALRAKYRRCCHPYGCDRTAPFVQSDHVRAHIDGGPTDLSNGQILDGGHNIYKENERGHDPPPGPCDTGQRRLPPDVGPPR